MWIISQRFLALKTSKCESDMFSWIKDERENELTAFCYRVGHFGKDIKEVGKVLFYIKSKKKYIYQPKFPCYVCCQKRVIRIYALLQ